MVSILVFLDQALKAFETMADGVEMDLVSILVFLDQALKAPHHVPGQSSGTRFNPCFPGSSAERMKKAYHGQLFLCFNPCFPGSSAERIRIFKIP